MSTETTIQQPDRHRSPVSVIVRWSCVRMVFIASQLMITCLLMLACLPTMGMAQPSADLPTTSKVFSGVITELNSSEISVRGSDGQVERFIFQGPSARAVSVDGKAFNIPADIQVTGAVPMKLVERGMVVRFQALCTVDGECEGRVQGAYLVNESDLASQRVDAGTASASQTTKQPTDQMKVEFLERPADRTISARVEVVGRVLSFASNKLLLRVQPGRWAQQGRIEFEFTADAKLILKDRSLDRAVPGDAVRTGQALVFASGEKVVQRLRVVAAGKRDSLTKSFQGKLENKFRHLSNEPSKPREVRSAHFVLQTDVSDRSAKILLAKLETMYKLVSGYFQQQPRRPIECYIVRDLAAWSTELDPAGVKQIREGSGLTVSQRLGGQTKAVVYACDDHAIAQHEAVHAFCAETFGGLGPVWYSEGMAEMGQYWQPDVRAVNIDPIVIGYLKNASESKLTDIVAAGQITGDSWQAYASRWAICYLLANNPNYAQRFKTLGVHLMTGQPGSLKTAFVGRMEQMSFEHRQFLENLGNGYRVDLCSWDWKTKPKELAAADRIDCMVRAQAGWQATGLLAEPGQAYDFASRGQWSIGSPSKLDADGDEAGQGALVGVWLDDYQLSEPFALGTRGKFVAKQKGQLFVRCRDAWTKLDDNKGHVKLYLRKAKK